MCLKQSRSLTVSDAPSGRIVVSEPCCTRPMHARTQKAPVATQSRASRPPMPRLCGGGGGGGA
eukprot:scaffold3022_cov63-Phaeocystis_antarctica.AAC.2